MIPIIFLYVFFNNWIYFLHLTNGISYFYMFDTILILIASFFYMASPMLVTPLITGFSQSIGASSTMMGMIGGTMYLCSLICRPFMGNLSDKISKYKLSFIGALLVCAFTELSMP